MKIIHLSDLHISKDFNRKNIKKFKFALKHALKKTFDHLVITGDLSDNADEQDYIVIRQILKQYNLLDSNKTSIIIGNHDIFGGVQTAADVFNFPSKCKSVNYNYQVSTFISHFEELFVDCHFASSDKFFPYYKNLGSIGIVGINSIANYSKISNPMASTGKVGKQQLIDLQKIIAIAGCQQQPKIALIHHHFYKNNFKATSPQNTLWNKIESYTLRLKNKKKIIKTLKECGIELVLHGHSHEVLKYERKGLLFVNAGGSIENEYNTLSFFLINFINGKFFAELENISFLTKKLIAH